MPPMTYHPESPISIVKVRSRIVSFLPICSLASYTWHVFLSEDIRRKDYIILFQEQSIKWDLWVGWSISPLLFKEKFMPHRSERLLVLLCVQLLPRCGASVLLLWHPDRLRHRFG